MAKFRTYDYQIINPEKFTNGGKSLTVKSSWELEFAKHCDLIPSVISWGYETTQIPYRDPLTGKQKIYIPDFFVKIAQRDGYAKDMVFEIKPMHEQLDEHARNRQDAALIARNNAKWMAATQWADRHSAEFQVLNQNDIFGGYENKKGRMHPVKSFAHTTTKASKPTAKATRSVSSKRTKPKLSMRQRVSKARSRKAGKVGRVGKS